MKKFMILILTIVCFACIGMAAACNEEPNYYVLTLESVKGVTYECDIPSGYEVKEGAEVSFRVKYSDSIRGEAIVKANDDVLTADETGLYTFTMQKETSVTVTGISYVNTYNIKFDKGDNRVTFRDTEGNEIDNVFAEDGEVLSFSMDISVYYAPDCDYSVLANTLILSEQNGLYNLRVTGDTTITVSGLEMDTNFTERRNGGSGTATDPYIIERPVDLYVMSSLVSNAFYNGRFGAAHYKLAADLDMKGEQVFMIGDGMVTGYASLTSYFAGEFDGNGHTISNYYIADTEIEQDGSYSTLFMPYIGLFGFVSANVGAPVEIHDLHLKNFTIDIDGAKLGGNSFFAGGLIGYGIGVNVTGCTVEGVINANGPTDANFGYIGGVAGRLLSAYGSEEVKYNSTVVSTQANVEINGNSGWLYAAGGIVGSLESSDDAATSYILNSYSSANVSGAINTGGLVGYMGAYTAVKNSYFAGNYVEANSNVPDNANYTSYAHSYAGGIAGYASYDTVISGCFARGQVSAYSVAAGSSFNHTGDIAGYQESAGKSFVEASDTIIINSYKEAAGRTLTQAFATDTLNWIASDWNFEGTYPVPKNVAEGEFTLTFNYGTNSVNGNTSKQVELKGAKNMAQLYEDADSGVERFVASASARSYGYFFDSTLTQRVPLGYVPYGNETLYAGFADYSLVSGRYYIAGGNGAYLELCDDGQLVYRDGAFSHTTFYTFDGNVITLYENAAFEVIESYPMSDGTTGYSSLYFSATATATNDGILTIINIASGYDGTAVVDLSRYYTAASPLSAIKQLDNFVYGNYSASNTTYSFAPDRTGTMGTTTFTYTVDGSKITLNTDGGVLTGTVDSNGLVTSIGNTALTAFDAFYGAWEKSAGSVKQFAFDGRGQYTYNYYEKVSGSEVLRTETGTYTVESNVLTTDRGVAVSFDGNGFLEVDFGNYRETFYKQTSFVGEWKYFNATEAISLTFNGVNNDGYGTGTVVYGANRYITDFDYSVLTELDEENEGEIIVTAILYDNDALLGELTFNASDNTLRGAMFSYYYNSIQDGTVFCMYDDFRGEWISEEFGIIQFNGLGRYDVGGTGTGMVRTRGIVTINGQTAGTYTVDGHILSGSFEYEGKTYNIVFNEATKAVNVTESDRSFDLIGLDELHGITYVSDNGDEYVFNGGGNLPGGGKLSVNGIYTYTYKITAYGAEIFSIGGYSVGEFRKSASANVMVINLNGLDINLTVTNSFTGEWVVGGAVDGKLVIGKIGADFTANGSYLGASVQFVYDAANNRLSFTTASDEKLYINCFTYNGPNGVITELTVGDNEYGYGSYNICLPESRVGELKGVYRNSDSNYIYLDGMNTGMFANGRGTAVIVIGIQYTELTYRYSGDLLLLVNTTDMYILRSVSPDTPGAYVNGNTAFELLVPDAFYSVRVGDSSENPTYYTFDGIGGVTDSKGKTYTYVIEAHNQSERTYTITLTDSDGVVYTAIYDYSDTYATISVVQEGGTVTE